MEDPVALNREEFNRATAMFDDMDRDHDGVIDIIEFQAMMEQTATRTGRECERHTSCGVYGCFTAPRSPLD